MPQTIFQANLSADKIFIDLANMPSTITQHYQLWIQNQSLQVLYFKVVNAITNWGLSNPVSGQLGSVAAGSTTAYSVQMTRTNPTTETIDTGYLEIDVYSDAGYSVFLDSAQLNCTVYLETLESWSNVQILTFATDADSFTGGTRTSEISVETGGYSYLSPEVPYGSTQTKTLTRINTSIPDYDKVRICVYFVHKHRANYASARTSSLNYFQTLIDAVPVLTTGIAGNTNPLSSITTSTVVTQYSQPWYKLVVDITLYRNLIVTLAFLAELTATAPDAQLNASFIIDRIVIAGNN